MVLNYSSVIVMLIGFISQASAIDNCFFDNYLTYAYNIPDTSGNYTSVKEYWMKHNPKDMEPEWVISQCEMAIDTDTKMTWYSSDISVDVLKYWQKTDEDCKAPEQAPGVPADPQPYLWDWPLVMGSEDEVTDTNPVKNEGVLCLVKYTVKNKNKHHDMRVQLFKVGDEHDLEGEAASFLTSSIALGVMAIISFVI